MKFNLFGRAKKRALSFQQQILGWVESTYTGKNITPDTATQISTVWACATRISQTVASVPLHVYKRLPGGGKERVTDHPVAKLLRTMPNSYQTSMSWREQMTMQQVLKGNTYAQIIRNGAGEIKELIPLQADYIKTEYNPKKGDVFFKAHLRSGETREYTRYEILFIPATQINGVEGVSPIEMGRQCLALGLAQEEYAARFFGNGAMPAGVLEHPGTLGTAALENLKKSWAANYGGIANTNKMAILEEGMKLHTVSFSLEQTQFLESRNFQIPDMCRWFLMAPHMIGHLEKATNNNIEQMSREFIDYTMRPWFVRWEQALSMQLFDPNDWDTYYVEFLVDGLLRGDTLTRYQAYQIAITNGFLSRDEVRELENRSPIPDGKGKEFTLVHPGATNMPQPGSTLSPASDEPEPKQDDESKRSARLADFLDTWEPMTRELMMRVVRKASNAISKASSAQAKDSFISSFGSVFRDDFEIVVIPILESMNRHVRDTTDLASIPSAKLFDAFWTGVQRHSGTLHAGPEQFFKCAIDCLRNSIIDAYQREKLPPAPIVNINVEPTPVQVNVTMPEQKTQKAVVTNLEFKRNADGKISGATKVEEIH